VVCGGGGLNKYQPPAADALQPPLRSGFRAQLRRGVRLPEAEILALQLAVKAARLQPSHGEKGVGVNVLVSYVRWIEGMQETDVRR
jgi:hypothetical protein